MSKIETLLARAQTRLVETGTRNRLIHVNRNAKRGNFLNITNERSDDIFEILRLNSKRMKFAGTAREQDEGINADDMNFEEIADEEFDEGHYTNRILDTPLTPDALQKRLLKLAKDARTAEEEQGINILFLAMGFLQWYENPNSQVLRESPLILVPVELVRNNRTSTYEIRCRDDDIVTNLSLQERLKLDFGITLPDIDDSTDWIPSEYCQRVEKAISREKRWTVELDAMQIGFFSFAKLMMFHDLDPENWDEQSLIDNQLVSGLLADGFKPDDPLFGDSDNLDAELPLSKMMHVVDADSSQSKVIEEVRSGRNLIVQGPPGTGKSQTITNILAAVAHEGKKVLFVAEKMAALEVVYSRLCKIGLEDLCLVLHSRSANKKVFLESLAETIKKSKGVKPSKIDDSSLKATRDKLNQIVGLLHQRVPDRDYTPYQILSRLIHFAGKNSDLPQFNAEELESLSEDAEKNLLNNLDEYIEIVKQHGLGSKNPFYGAKNLDLQPTDLQRLVDEMKSATDLLSKWISQQQTWEEKLTSSPPGTLASAVNACETLKKIKSAPNNTTQFVAIAHKEKDNLNFIDALSAAINWVAVKEKMDNVLNEAVWSHEIDHLRQPLVKGVGSFLSRIFGSYRSASKELSTYLKRDLPKSPVERLNLLDEIVEAKNKKSAFNKESDHLKSRLDQHWRGEKTLFRELQEVLQWLDHASVEFSGMSSEKISGLIEDAEIAAFAPDDFNAQKEAMLKNIKKVWNKFGFPERLPDDIKDMPLSSLREKLLKLSENINLYNVWTSFQFSRDRLLTHPVSELIDFVEAGKISIEHAKDELIYALAETRWNYCRQQRPKLAKLSQLDRHDLVFAFMSMEKNRIGDVQKIIRDTHLAQVPQGSVGEMGFIRGEIAKRRKRRPIRQVMTHAAEMLQRIKPVFLMSPISVAQFLPPSKVEFDLLVIDEASQVRPEDALGSIARAKQIVVVGDQKQLPPTSFFSRLTDNEEEEEDMVEATAMESILSLCEARGLNESMLEWHYRSKDPSLITVSNEEFYNNRLILPPCPTESDDNFGLKLVRVPGVYSTLEQRNGRPTTNRVEAEEIATRLKELAQTRPYFSVGIATFSKTQADMVTEVLELQRRENDLLDCFLREDKAENVFVKNIENVQGDERDIILISVGYGPHEPNGRLPTMNFGPINSEGGERRLNVLFSRARFACEVFISFDPSEMNLNRTTNKGPTILKRFLEYAKTGEFAPNYVSKGEADSLFEEDVAQVIRDLGYEVDHQVGTAGFKIDLGVRNPNSPEHHMLAVECDGATYHSALWARERDRMRQEILEGFGWNFHRVWSTDWFYRRNAEIERLRAALDSAKSRGVDEAEGANTAISMPEEVDSDSTDNTNDPIILEDTAIEVPLYQKADIDVSVPCEPHECPINLAVEILNKIIDIEGPVHVDEIARRYASFHGKTRVGSRIHAYVVAGLKESRRLNFIENQGEFWANPAQFRNVPVRNRSNETEKTLDAKLLPPMEIIACAELIEKESGEVEEEEMIRVIAKTLGFKRAGSEFQTIVKRSLRAKRS